MAGASRCYDLYSMRHSLLLCTAALAFAGTPLSDTYKAAADRIIDAALTDNGGWEKLSYLCDRIGNRLAGSKGLEEAIQWAASEMKKDGLVNVATPPVSVPHWERGEESLTMVAPVSRTLVMLGLGGSVATPKEGITAEVIPVGSFDELDKLGAERIQGKIVLYNVPFTGYGRTVRYRVDGASRAARLGAVAALVRSVTPLSLQSAHTGVMTYAAGAPKIPTSAVTIEGATMIQRLVDSGATVRVHLEMSARTLPDAPSANVIGEIRGSEKPDEIVVIGGHIDSWDVGQGAQDDGVGIVASMQAAAILQKLGLKPRRTIRVVLFTNEENGSAGGLAYRAWAGESVKNHVAAIEMDGGGEKFSGFGVPAKFLPQAAEIGRLFDRIGASVMTGGGGGADISPIMQAGVPGFALHTVGTHYFDWHHSQADTVDKVDPKEFRENTAAMAVMAYILADMPD
jgi:Iap family predicted aminopeptidase